MDPSSNAPDQPSRTPRAAESGKARPGILAAVAALLVVVVAAGVMVASGGGIDSSSSGSSSASSSSGSGSEPRPVPEFTAELRGGGTLASTDIEGPAMIQVFASWCPSCQAHAPEVAKVQAEFDQLNPYYINVADDAEPAAGFVDEYDWADAPVLVDDDRAIAGEFGLTGQPHTIFVDADGNVTDILQGGGSLGEMQAAAERATSA